MERRVSEDFSRQMEVPSDGEESCGKSSQGTSRKQLLVEMLRVLTSQVDSLPSVMLEDRRAVKTVRTNAERWYEGRKSSQGTSRKQLPTTAGDFFAASWG